MDQLCFKSTQSQNIEGISETKIVLFIVFNKMQHKVEIPLGGGSQMIPQVNTASSLTRLSTIANVSEVSAPTQYVPQVTLPKPQYVPQVSLPKPQPVPQVTVLKPQYLPTTYITTDSTQYTITMRVITDIMVIWYMIVVMNI